MIRTTALLSIALLTTAVLAGPKDDVLAAAKKLAEGENYTWVSAADAGGTPLAGGPTTGKIDKAGYVTVSLSRNSGIVFVFKGEKRVLRAPTGWTLPEEVTKEGSSHKQTTRVLALATKNFKTAADEAKDLVAKTKELRAEKDGMYAGEFTDAAAKELVIRLARFSLDVPEARDAKATVSFWVKDGMLSKFQYFAYGKVTIRGQEREFDRLITTTISEIGSTKVDVPEEAKKLLD